MTDSSFCQQRKLMQMFNVPLTRFTPVNPYTTGNFTKMQLDMRRKAEVLKYSANKSSSQTNNLTKKQQFALLIKGGIASPSQAVMSSDSVTCDTDEMMLTPTTSCDVPGPVMYLYNDKTVPLYNYSDFNTRTYPDFIPNNLEQWQFVEKSDILVYDNGTSILYYLIINNSISKSLYTYNIVTPVGLTMAGLIPPGYVPPSGFNGNVSLQINSASLLVYYNNELVKTVVIDLVNLSGFAVVVNIPIVNTSSVPLPFSIKQFIGNLAFNNVQLYTTASYVYTFVLSVDTNISQSDTGVIDYIAVIANMSTSNVSSATGCSIVSLGRNSINMGTSISGV